MTNSDWTLPVELSPPLSPREEIADVLYRCLAGLDTPDRALWESSFAPDACCIMDGRLIEGIDDISAQVYEPISRLDTTHLATNLRIHIGENGTEASMSASALAQHFSPGTGREPGAPRLLTGGPYMIHLVKNAEAGGRWLIKRFQLAPRWAEGDMTVVTGKGSAPNTA